MQGFILVALKEKDPTEKLRFVTKAQEQARASLDRSNPDSVDRLENLTRADVNLRAALDLMGMARTEQGQGIYNIGELLNWAEKWLEEALEADICLKKIKV